MSRARSFDPGAALDAAMQLFWQRGFEATSVQDVVERTGVNRSSLYGLYADKQELFARVLDRYDEKVVAERLGRLEHPDAGLAEIRGYFAGIAARVRAGGNRDGCLMTNTAIECRPRYPGLARVVARHLARMHKAFRTALTQARRSGGVAAGCDLDAVASFLTSAAQGLAIQSRAGATYRSVSQSVRVVLESLEAQIRRAPAPRRRARRPS